ncbi:MAG TPA: hypothetical protein VFV38_42390 [Ktedonobacteraceae bacterium]|nr:hypothetical protein [Ktedonobacteraceae bacterium]
MAEEHAATACGSPVRPHLNGNQGRREPMKQEPGLVTTPGNPPD